MKVYELSPEEIVIGLRIKSLISDKVGTIVKIDDESGDKYNWVLWDGESEDDLCSGFYDNNCQNEVVGDTNVKD